MYDNRFLEALEKFYAVVDEASSQLSSMHANRLNCKKGCFNCCVDDIEVFGIEAEHIRRSYADLLANDTPHQKGACAFLNTEGACRIYSARPFVCRTQGLPLRFLQEEHDDLFELRDICPLNEEGEPLLEMDSSRFFFTTPYENALAEIQLKADQGKMERIVLRDLFNQ